MALHRALQRQSVPVEFVEIPDAPAPNYYREKPAPMDATVFDASPPLNVFVVVPSR
jgi:hypothetical protein